MNLEKTPVLDDRETTRPADSKFSKNDIYKNILSKIFFTKHSVHQNIRKDKK